jgi:hypothetical protein
MLICQGGSMKRCYVNVILITTILIIIAGGIYAGENPEQSLKGQAAIPADMALSYSNVGADRGIPDVAIKTPPMVLGPVETNAVGVQVGATTFDYQHNCTMGRQIEHRGSGYLHFDWMIQTDMFLGGDRGIGYQVYDLSQCDFVFVGDGIRVNTEYAGYVNLDVDPGGCGIPTGHERNAGDGFYYATAYWDSCLTGSPSAKFDSDAPSDIYGWWINNGTGPDNENIWPVIDWQVGTETVLHMVCTESGGAAGDPQTISYYRRAGAYGVEDGGSWSSQRLIDTVMVISPVVAASPFSDRVAIAWNAPVDFLRDTPGEFVGSISRQYLNDVWFAASDNQGADWIAGIGSGSIGHEVDNGIAMGYDTDGGNITTYGWGSEWKAYCNTSALFAHDDNLHIVWNCRRFTDTSEIYRRNSGIFHWSEDNPSISTVVTALWDVGGTCYAHSWGSDADKPSISECDNKLYILYTQFGNEQDPCYDYSSSDNIINGELYLTGSDDGGASWDEPQNLTNSVTHLCAAGDCESDYWPTMARYGRMETCGDLAGYNVLDILYINDRHAGGVAQNEGDFTVNPVMWLATPCRAIGEDTCSAQNLGDVDNNGSIESDDLLYLTQFLYEGGPTPPVMPNADVNADCWIDGADIKYLDDYLNCGGPDPDTCTCVYPEVCDCKVGDANGDQAINLGDGVYINNLVFRPDTSPLPTPYPICSGDANKDCTVNLGDAVFINNVVFHSGPMPVYCHEWIQDPPDGCGSLKKDIKQR